jgi:hypothetical protein
MGAFALWNTWFFGAPWITSYHSVLARDNDVAQVVAHAPLFNTPLLKGAEKMLFGDRSLSHAFPLLFPALFGLLPLLRRHRALGLAFALSVPIPIAFYLPYDWYNERFLYPLFGLAGLPIAVLLSMVVPAERTTTTATDPTSWRPSRRIVVVVVVVVLACAGVVRAVTWRSADLLSTHLEQAKVFVDQSSGAGGLEVEVLARGQPPFKALLVRGGDSFSHVATWAGRAQTPEAAAAGTVVAGQGAALEILVKSKKPAMKPFVIEGRLQ